MRSPEAIAAEAAAQAQARAAQVQAAEVQAGLRAQAYMAAQDAAAAGDASPAEARESNDTPAPAEQAPGPEPAPEVAAFTAVQGEREGGAGEATNDTMPAEQRERATDMNPALPD